LPWSGEKPPYGFTRSSDPTWLPQPGNWSDLSVESEQGVSTSTLKLYEFSLSIRTDFSGNVEFIESGDPDVMLFKRDNGIHVAANTGGADYQLPEFLQVAEVILDSEMVKELGDKTEVLPPNCARWFRVIT
jgi:alpha-glucosidase